MLPFDRKKQPTIVGPSNGPSDLGSEAKKRCMSRFINAVQSGDVNAAVDAMTDYHALREFEEYD